jgi:hypothetical protein
MWQAQVCVGKQSMLFDLMVLVLHLLVVCVKLLVIKFIQQGVAGPCAGHSSIFHPVSPFPAKTTMNLSNLRH